MEQAPNGIAGAWKRWTFPEALVLFFCGGDGSDNTYLKNVFLLELEPKVKMVKCFKLPSGKLTFNYGKSQFLMGNSTINCHFQ
jgi:hypothetical protein